MKEVELEKFITNYKSGRSMLVELLWYIINILLFKNPLVISYKLKVFFLRLFGCDVGVGVVIKPSVNIKYPWKLSIGDFSWIGEGVWIDNLDHVKIEKNVCISQGSLLQTGNHNYKKCSFDLMTSEIYIEKGVWVCSKSIILPGSYLSSHTIVLPGSVLSGRTNKFSIYSGNPAIFIKDRTIS